MHSIIIVCLIGDFDMALASERSSEHLDDCESPTLSDSSSDESDFDMVSGLTLSR